MRRFPAVTILAFLLALPRPGAAAESDAALRSACESALAEAGRAIERHGVTDSAMIEIRAALARLATQPALKDGARLRQIHGSSTSNAAVLASRGDDSLTLFLTRFEPGHATPVHDHQTWGVLHVLEGRDQYVQWDAEYPQGGHERADVRMATGALLVPGASVFWFPPPHDLHSQQAVDGVVWELLIAGRNFLSPSVMGHRHYFDPKSGGVTHMPVK